MANYNPDSIKAFFEAVEENKFDIVESLLKSGVDPNITQGNQDEELKKNYKYLRKYLDVNYALKGTGSLNLCRTPLIIASKLGYLSIVKLLVQYNADINQQDSLSFTPLMFAAKEGHREIVKYLLELNADIKLKELSGKTALKLAVDEKHSKVVELFATQTKSSKKKIDLEALVFAVEKRNIELVKSMFDSSGKLNLKNRHGANALIKAVSLDQIEIVKLLIKVGADVNFTYDGEVALYYVTSIEMLDLLLKAGANPNALDRNNASPLIRILQGKCKQKNSLVEMVKLLLDSGADPNLQDRLGFSTLMMAIISKREDIVTLLIQAGANLEITTTDRETALVVAVNKRAINIIKQLIEAGANVNVTNELGTPLLFLPIAYNQIYKDDYPEPLPIVELLLKAGANINQVKKDGTSLLDMAQRGSSKEIIEFLKNAGAKCSKDL